MYVHSALRLPETKLIPHKHDNGNNHTKNVHGATNHSVAAVHEGYALTKSVARSPAGGALLTALTRRLLETEAAAKGVKQLLARHQVAAGAAGGGKKGGGGAAKKGGGGGGGKGGGGGDAAGAVATTASYDAWALEQLADDAKEALVRAADDAAPLSDAFDAGEPRAYELPDGTRLSVGAPRFAAAEALFSGAAALEAFPGAEVAPILAGRDLLAWPGGWDVSGAWKRGGREVGTGGAGGAQHRVRESSSAQTQQGRTDTSKPPSTCKTTCRNK